MKNLELKLKKYLENEPKARERRNKTMALANFLADSHPQYIRPLGRQLIMTLIDETISLERYWRKILLEYPSLRGSDYNDKKIVSQKKQIELGYEAGANVKLKI